jgi:hypothetical protein
VQLFLHGLKPDADLLGILTRGALDLDCPLARSNLNSVFLFGVSDSEHA